MLDSLHEIGTQRDKSHNRDLHMDQYGVLVLMWMFNPILTSLRGLQQASTLKDVQKKFGVERASLGSLSESVSIFDPEPLKQIAAQLATEVPSADPSKFDAIGHQLTAVDGSVFKTAVRVASLAWLPDKAGGTTKGKSVDGYRMHTHFEILRGIPERMDATPAKPKGKDDEKSVLASVLQPDRCYVTDRGYAKFELFNQINAIGSCYICRVRDNSTPKILSDRELTQADRDAGVRIDREVVLGACKETKGSKKQRGQTSFSVSSGNGRTRGRPLGRIVDSRLSRLAIDSTQPSSPSGAPRFAQIRIAFNSLSDNGSLTRETQFGSRGIGHGDKNFGSGSDRWSQRQREPHRQSSARAVMFALNAFRST
ncbi:hypothetical protein GCM10023156_00360 [Novipirellula rosea]|uniref:Transposase IS4-like domain-containing protein n=1 Tax=Novipirellula rosea TaxID=1031540 RepID=A0ABP8M4M4_9BACT